MIPNAQMKQEPRLTRPLGLSTRTQAPAGKPSQVKDVHPPSGSVGSIPFTPTTSWSKNSGKRWRKAWESIHLSQGTSYRRNQSRLEKHELQPKKCRKRHCSAPEATKLLEILLDLGRPNDKAQDKAIRRLADGMKVYPGPTNLSSELSEI